MFRSRTWPDVPDNVADVSVTVNGVTAALTYVSPTQINFQVPWETPPGRPGWKCPCR